MTKQILTVHPVTLHVEPKPYTTAAFEFKCRKCGRVLPDTDQPPPVLCPHDKEVMDYTPVKKDYHGK